MKNSISVIITAYKTAEYIEECLDSIYKQLPEGSEILVGVDSCKETLEKITEIRAKYPILKVFFSEKNIGTYIMKNSLFEKISCENILFFDSDDILCSGIIDRILSENSNYVRFRFANFTGSDLSTMQEPKKGVAHGVFFISTELFRKIGGFQPWKCSADSEFITRTRKNNVQYKSLEGIGMFRRIHCESLTQKIPMSNPIRSTFKSRIERNINWKIPINRTTSEITEC